MNNTITLTPGITLTRVGFRKWTYSVANGDGHSRIGAGTKAYCWKNIISALERW